MLLEGKNAVIYGGGGVIGAAVARSFAGEGARVFLTGPTPAKLDAVAEDIRAAGGDAQTARVDALDKAAVDEHAAAVGRIDISFNAFGKDMNDFGVPLVDLPVDDFFRPVTTWLRTQLLTATAAARQMAPRESGVILTLSSSVGRMPGAMSGGLLVASAAIEALSRQLAFELGPRGIRVVCLRPDGIRESARLGSVTREVWRRAVEAQGMSIEDYLDAPPENPVLPRTVTLREVVDVATFLASDRAGALTASVVDISCGQTPD